MSDETTEEAPSVDEEMFSLLQRLAAEGAYGQPRSVVVKHYLIIFSTVDDDGGESLYFGADEYSQGSDSLGLLESGRLQLQRRILKDWAEQDED